MYHFGVRCTQRTIDQAQGFSLREAGVVSLQIVIGQKPACTDFLVRRYGIAVISGLDAVSRASAGSDI